MEPNSLLCTNLSFEKPKSCTSFSSILCQNLSLESDPGKLEKEMKEKGQVSIILNFKHILLINFEVYSLVPMLFQ